MPEANFVRDICGEAKFCGATWSATQSYHPIRTCNVANSKRELWPFSTTSCTRVFCSNTSISHTISPSASSGASYVMLTLAQVVWTKGNKLMTSCTPATLTDLISIYWFFNLKIWQNTDFSPLKLGEIQIFFLECQSFFPSTVLFHTDFFPKILIFMVIYTNFVWDDSGRSALDYRPYFLS